MRLMVQSPAPRTEMFFSKAVLGEKMYVSLDKSVCQ